MSASQYGPQYPPGGESSGYPYARLAYLQGGPVYFGEAVRQAFQNWRVYRGRASRSAFWWFDLFQVVVGIAVYLIVGLLVFGSNGGGSGAGSGQRHVSSAGHFVFLIVLVYLCSFAVPGLALLVRRLHDTGKSGWWVFIGFLPVAGPIIMLIFTVTAGTPGPNRYQLEVGDLGRRSSRSPTRWDS
jgi:uncharacterized membrane protein YhaH (DUF805 family)